MEDKLWKHEKSKKPRGSAAKAEGVSFGIGIETVQDENRSGTLRLPPQGPSGCHNRHERRSRGVLGEGRAEWEMVAASLHDDVLLIPKNLTSERPMALVPTLIRWWEALKAPEEKWQQEDRVDWDATDGRNGGAQQTVLDILMEMERFKEKAKEEDQGALAMVLDLAKAFERVSLPLVWAWATLKEVLASAVRVF